MPYDPTGFVSIPPELIRGFSWKQPVACATTGNITLSGTQTIDGHAAVAGERVLVKNQSTGSQNGIWVCASGAWTRAFDMDQDSTTAIPSSEVMGAFVYVLGGTVNGGSLWRNTNTSAPTLGTTALTFTLAISSTGSALDDLSDVTITSAAAGQKLRFDGSVWRNVVTWHEPQVDYTGSAILDGAGNPIMVEVVS